MLLQRKRILSGSRHMIKNAILWLFFPLVGVTGCMNHTQLLYSDAAQQGRLPLVIDTGTFLIQTVIPGNTVSDSLRVYLEGDGKAWATRTQPSTDPTPTTPLVSKLAANDPAPSAYIARPCQYVMNNHCSYKIWTDRRFSAEAVESISTALDKIKLKMGASNVELVGYSGGGAIALLLAARRSDVTSVQTLAGNLTPAGWVRLHQLSPISEALEPVDYRDRLRHIPQRHLVGTLDPVIPASLAQAFTSSMPDAKCLELREVKATHEQGWEAAWAIYRDRPISCKEPGFVPRIGAN
ncbi:alpha/beta fold hydrolase [Pseudomonas aeruginosa]|uniref:alpha/beta fold hydrolase n=1 Tax=Pseudomonas aeruginosa TaxID=287 RepID=UPI0025CB74F7|nr:alpha/beta hydrolase [Pseudomonas aeruginosa]